MAFFRGAKPSPPDPRDFRFSAEHYAAPHPQDVPQTVDLRGGSNPTKARPVGPVRDQGQEGSCVGHATTELREALRVAAGASFVRYSPAFTYYLARLAEGTPSEDSGCTPRDALDSMLHRGVCPEQNDPYVPGQFATAPTQDQYNDARFWRIGSYHALDLTNLASAQQCLAAGYPISITIPAGSPQFQEVGSNGEIVDSTALADRNWDHETLLCGYDPNWLICMNSWGTGWGNQGYFYLPVSCWSSGFIYEAWTASLKVQA